MLSISNIDVIHSFQYLMDLFDALRIAEEVDRLGILMRKIHESNAGRAVQDFWPVDDIELVSYSGNDLLRRGDALNQLYLQTMITKFLGLQEKCYSPSEKVVPAKLDAGILDILGKLGEDKFLFHRRRSKSPSLAHRSIIVLFAQS